MKRFSLTIVLALVAVLAASSASAGTTTVLRLNGIGPLKLGMTQAAALHTGWLAHRAKGCELDPRRPVTYRLTGHKAPAGLLGSVQFAKGRLENVTVTHGARTSAGVTVGVTSPRRMGARYRKLGFTATVKFDNVFQGTFVMVKRKHQQVIGAFATGPAISQLAIPNVLVCE